MRFVIRADATVEMGSGHVMRCSAIAEELIDRGQEVLFVGDTSGLPWVRAKMDVIAFSESFDNQASFQPDAETDVLILDSYELDPLDPFLHKTKWLKIIAIVDDTTPKFHANLYIHPGAGTTWLPNEKDNAAPFISGIQYLAIRKSIRELRRNDQSQDHTPLKILITGGGSDPFDFCGAVADLLQVMPEDFLVNIFSDRQIRSLLDSRFRFIEIGSRLEEFLVDADIIFTTAGTSSWEFLSLGFPIGLACAIDNQYANYEYQTRFNLVVDIGGTNDRGLWSLKKTNIEDLVKDPEIRSRLSSTARAYVDARGSSRIVDIIQDVSGR